MKKKKKKPAKPEIDWLKRWKKADTQMAERRVLESRCRMYKIEESNIKYGRKYKRNGDYLGYPIWYRAMAKLRCGWVILSNHFKLSAAEKALEYHNQHGQPKPKPKKRRKKVKREDGDT